MIGFLLFVKPALRQLAGRLNTPGPTVKGRLEQPFRHRGDRMTYYPSCLRAIQGSETPTITLLNWAGSADLKTVAEADGFAVFPTGDRDYLADEIVAYLPLG